jgi:hypothetical protein
MPGEFPVRKTINLPYGDKRTFKFQLMKNGTPVNLTGAQLIFYVKSVSDFDWQPKKLNVVLDDPPSGKFSITLSTQDLKMKVGRYIAEIEWVNENFSLIYFDITIYEDVMHGKG